eukprot:scaffold18613_cov112-Isochrysis_galbana.AAC.9
MGRVARTHEASASQRVSRAKGDAHHSKISMHPWYSGCRSANGVPRNARGGRISSGLRPAAESRGSLIPAYGTSPVNISHMTNPSE